MTVALNSIARRTWLGLLCGAAAITLVNALTKSPAKSTLNLSTAVDLSQAITLNDWQMLESTALPAHKFPDGMISPGRQYRYQSTGTPATAQPIEIEVRYIADGVANRPTVDAMLPIFTKIPATVLQPATLKQSPLGSYSLFRHQQKAYFSTCINPQGQTTVSGDEFHSNSNPKPLDLHTVNRLLPWLLGQQTLRDSRCVWTVLSTPIDPATADGRIKALETIGVSWIRWWQIHFPAA